MNPIFPTRGARAFTLVELLVVIGIIALLISILLPSLNRARAAAFATVEVSQLRQMQTAHVMYVNDNDSFLIDAGLDHDHDDHAESGDDDDDHDDHGAGEQGGWIVTLERYYTDPLVLRSPVDDSPHWPGGTPVEVHDDGDEVFRRTSYGINDHLSSLYVDDADRRRYAKITDVKASSDTVHFLLMAHDGEFAAADHPHTHEWGQDAAGDPEAVPTIAAGQIETNAHGGERATWDARTAYGFLDGHAEVRTFRAAWNGEHGGAFISAFDPATADRVRH